MTEIHSMRELEQLQSECRRLEAECFSLSAWACIHFDGKTGIVHDEHGNSYCAKDKEIERLRAEVQIQYAEGFHDGEAQGSKMKREYLERQSAEIERLRAAISWIYPPFVDDNTPEAELRQRIKLCIADADRAALNEEPRIDVPEYDKMRWD